MTLAAEFRGALAAMGLDLPDARQARLLAFIALLQKWNRTYNLTAIRDEKEMLTHHLLDSLSLLPALGESALTGRRWADVGSGAGLPGIPLAIACPDLNMTSIETVEKKAASSARRRSSWAWTILRSRTVVSRQVPAGGFDAVVSRAFADCAILCAWPAICWRHPGAFTP
jgi:16S rRNA (guanine527-N7)-methyltransferase